MSNKYKVLFSHWRGEKRTQAFNLHPQYYGPRLHITCLILVNTSIIKAQLHFLFQDSTSQFSWLPDLSRRKPRQVKPFLATYKISFKVEETTKYWFGKEHYHQKLKE